MLHATSERWKDLMAGFGVFPKSDMFDQLVQRYSEPHRHYHTLAHIDACLGQLDTVRAEARSDVEIEAALWFHDAIYSPYASDNERQSADMASTFLATIGAPRDSIDRVHAHVMATLHKAEPADPDSRLLTDIDLAILGQDASAYDEFERAICAEYRWVPRVLFRRKRIEVLQSFLDREHVYATQTFRTRYEAAARANLARAIAALKR